MSTSEILNRINNAKSLDFGTIFNESIELFKKTWVQGLVTLLLNMVLSIPILMLIYIPLIFSGMMDLYSGSYDPYNPYAQPDISPVTIVLMFTLYLFAIFAVSVLGLALKSAFYRICKLKDYNEMGKEDYFFFLKKPYLGKTISLGLVYIGIAFLATMLCFLPLLYVIVPLTHMFVVYAFNPDKSVSEITKISFDLGNKKWLLTFGLIIVSGLLASIVGMLMCFVGIYVTMSFTFLPPYLIYKEVIGFEDESSQIGQEVVF